MISLPSTTSLWTGQFSSLGQSSPVQHPTPTEIATPTLPLRQYVSEAWPIIRPATLFVSSWHIDCISDHLEAVTRGEIRNLIINIPPRHMKSLLVSVFWPTWEWTYQPHIQWLYASYADSLAIRDAVQSRRLINSPWYQERWGTAFRLTDDQNMKTKYENDHSGHRIATSVGGVGTGEGGDRLVADDPNKVKEAESEVMRETVTTWWDETMSTRGNDPKTVAKVVVQQRTHRLDLTGHLLETGDYHHLCLPAEYEPRIMAIVDHPLDPADPQPHDECAIHADPRTQEGELLCPDRFGAPELAVLKRALGTTYAIAGQLQQRPVPRAGALFKSEGFRPLPPDFDVVGADGRTLRQRLWLLQFWDLAYSEKTSADYTASLTLGYDPRTENAYLLNAWRTRVQEQEDATEDNRIGLAGAIANHLERLPQRPGLIGVWEGAFKKKPATHDLARRVMRILWAKSIAVRIQPVPEVTDKVFRAQLPAGRCEIGQVYADRTAPWWPAFEAECLSFPKGDHDDWVDCFSGALALAVALPNDQKQSINFTGGRAKPSQAEQFITIGGR